MDVKRQQRDPECFSVINRYCLQEWPKDPLSELHKTDIPFTPIYNDTKKYNFLLLQTGQIKCNA